MKIAILGATGRTGKLLTALALERGHTVTAVVRSTDRFDAVKLGAILPTVAVADARSADELRAAIDTVDAVAFCVGPSAREPGGILREAITATLTAMKRAKVYRIAAISASGPFIDGDDPLTRFLAKPIIQRIFADGFADFRAMESAIRESEIEWTIVRPPQLADGTARGRYRSRRDGNVRWGFQIRRADLAAAMLDVLLDDSTICETVSVAN